MWVSTPSSCAARDSKSSSLQWLRSHLVAVAADVTATDRRGYSALSVASFKGHAPVVALLLDAKADIEHVAEGDAPLTLACRRGRLEVARLLLAPAAPSRPPGASSRRKPRVTRRWSSCSQSTAAHDLWLCLPETKNAMLTKIFICCHF